MAKKKSATRRIIWIIVGLLVVLVILGVVGKATGFLGKGDDSIAVETALAETRSITQVVTASGKVQPEVEVKMSPDVSGEIIDLRVKEGDRVERGDLLVRIKADFYEAQVEQAEAGVSQAKATMAQRKADMLKAENELERQRKLFDKNAIAESEFEQAQTQHEIAKAAYEAAQYAVQSAEARLQESKEQLSKTAIYAPMSGTVSKLDVELGERVVGTSQMAGTEMMRIAKLNQMEIEIDVNENDVVNVAIGDTAAIEIDAYPDRTFKGAVTEIANSARVTGTGTQEQVTNFPVKVRILDPHNIRERQGAEQAEGVAHEEVPQPVADMPNFRPGMSGTVDVFTQTVPDAIAVPIQAVTVRDFNKVRPEGGEKPDSTKQEGTFAEEDLRKVVFAMEDGEAHMIEVETGISDDTHVAVKSGLEGGETIIIGPYRAVSRTLEPGMKVREEKQTGAAMGTFAAGQ